MDNNLVIIKLEDFPNLKCSDNSNILNKIFYPNTDEILEQFNEIPDNVLLNKNIDLSNIKFIRYEELLNEISCQDNHLIIDYILDITPRVPALKDRSPLSMSFVIKNSKKKSYKLKK